MELLPPGANTFILTVDESTHFGADPPNYWFIVKLHFFFLNYKPFLLFGTTKGFFGSRALQ